MTLAADRAFSLADRYQVTSGEVLITGIQALVRAPLDQLRADRQAGLRTTAFFSGYQGSPLGRYDEELRAQRDRLEEFSAVHQPGLNEELAATAVMGSQLAATFPRPRYDGVIGIWYGKAPGVERAGDAIHHAQFAGTARHGGVLALTGDDPAAKSSTLPSRTEVVLASFGLPVLYPGTMQDLLDLCRHGIAMSRASGLWTAIKVLTPVADGTGMAIVDPAAIAPVVPTMEVDGRPWTPELSGQIGPPHTSHREAEVLGTRIEMAKRYVELNGLNRFLADPGDAWLGIVAGGYTAELVVNALAALGLSPADAAQLGVRLLKLGALHPLDTTAVRRLAARTSAVLVVEDKTPFLETLVRDALYGTADAPVVLGKRDDAGDPLVQLTGTQTVESLIPVLRRVLGRRIPASRLAPPPPQVSMRITIPAEAQRTPYFCSGCPHNTGTKVPDGALVGAGIGCHGMVTVIDRPAQGQITGLTQMGGEGTQWIGVAPFVEDPHLFQNIGDGTYFHSGQLAVQAAVAAGVTITYKLLYNAAVAMTGGQDATGLLPVERIATKLLAEGVTKVAITTDEPRKYRNTELPTGVKVHHRDRIIEVQEALRELPGVTVLIHDQQCAAEKRRDRKRGLVARPGFKVLIDQRVCEGCGDCGVQSNCLSLQPADTEFGRTTVIDQASCNIDLSCLKGDCPAFVTAVPAAEADTPRRPRPTTSDLPDPSPIIPAAGATLRMPGIGGTGVVTVAQIIAAAAKIDGRSAQVIDQTGLSQKAGPVLSTITVGEAVPGAVDVVLAFDLLVATNPTNLSGLDPQRTVVIGSRAITPTGRMVGKVATADLSPAPYIDALNSSTREPDNIYADATRLTVGLLGSAVTANTFVLGMACQAGALPVSAAAVERAIELNGTAVEANIDAFRWGRRNVVDPAHVAAAAGLHNASDASTEGLEAFAADPELLRSVALRRAELRAYQSDRVAQRYLRVVRRCSDTEDAAGTDGAFTRAVALHLYRVMAYKDEYEVARLLLGSRQRVAAEIGPVDGLRYHLHPPMLRAVGLRRKLRLGRTALPILATLAAMRRLRGTVVDPFGHTTVRRAERQLITDYTTLVEEQLQRLAEDPDGALAAVRLVDMVRGYEHIKLDNLARYHRALAELAVSPPRSARP